LRAALRAGHARSWFLWGKALHVISVIARLAGLPYLPRLFAYNPAAPKCSYATTESEPRQLRLLRRTRTPSLGPTWLFGLAVVFVYPAGAGLDWTKGWVHTKAVAVILMTVLHHVYALWRKDLAAGRSTRSPRFYKMWNEVPAVLMVVIVIMVIGKPF